MPSHFKVARTQDAKAMSFDRSASIPAGVPAENITVSPLDPHMEIFDMRTGDVWLHQQPITEADYRSFKPEPPYVKSGLGRSAMDFAWFRRSPGADADGALERRVIGGLEWVRVARPRDFRGIQQGDAPTRLTIEKHHVIGFDAGTRVRLVRVPDGGWYVQQTAAIDGSIVPEPADWSLFHVDLDRRWVCDLGCPVSVYFFRNLRSFQGPLTDAQLPPGALKPGRGD
jgi:hypothetical protein